MKLIIYCDNLKNGSSDHVLLFTAVAQHKDVFMCLNCCQAAKQM